MHNKIIILSGPTASGKSALGIELAKLVGGEIVSCDSMQIYRGLDIGTAKITYDEMDGVPHHLLDIKYPNEAYSVAEFQQDARKVIAEIIARGNVPILVGGTGLYIQATVFDYVFEKRDILDLSPYEALSNESLYQKLQQIDYESSLAINPNNRRRVVYTLAQAEQTGRLKSDTFREQTHQLVYDIFPIALLPEREQLYARINERTRQLFVDGLLAEVDYFNKRYALSPQVQAAIGYKEPLAYIASGGAIGYETMLEKVQQNTRRFAKRQMTWIRNQKIVYQAWEPNTAERLTKKLVQFLTKTD